MFSQPQSDQITGDIGNDAQNVNIGKGIHQAIITGNVQTEAGDFIGRDQVTTQNITSQVVNIYNHQLEYLTTKNISIKFILPRAFHEFAAHDQARVLEAIRHLLSLDIDIAGIEYPLQLRKD